MRSGLLALVLGIVAAIAAMTLVMYAIERGAPVMGLLVVGLYFLPTVWAYAHHRRERASAVLLVNLLLGWTVIGWFAALVMANGKAARA